MNAINSWRQFVWLAQAALWVLTSAGGVRAESAYQVNWCRQLGTALADQASGVAADASGNVYICGFTAGALGNRHVGSLDAFVSKYGADGKLVWSKQIGTPEEDQCNAVAVDALGNVYLCGLTFGSMGADGAGGSDILLCKLDSRGDRVWTRQLGTHAADEGLAISIDGPGNVYVAGRTEGSLGEVNAGGFDAVASKYDPDGNLQWVRQFGTPAADAIKSIANDESGNVYVAGDTAGSIGGPSAGGSDAFLCKLDAQGSQLWARQLGTVERDGCHGIATDRQEAVYVCGYTAGNLQQPSESQAESKVNCMLCKYDAQGNLAWKRQMGGENWCEGSGVCADGQGHVYACGRTFGGLAGWCRGCSDAFICKYDSEGLRLWTWQWGTSDIDSLYGVAIDRLGRVYAAGNTFGEISDSHAGGADAFVVQLVPSEGPGVWILACGAAALFVTMRYLIARFH